MHDPTRLSLQAALMAMSVWVLGSLLLGAPYSVVGGGGIVILLACLVGVQVLVRVLAREDDPDDR